MKSIQWIAITSVTIAAAVWLCHFLFTYTYEEASVIVIINSSLIALAIAIGYTLICSLEKKETYNIFTAMLMPCMPVFALWLIVACFAPIFGFVLIALFPFLLIGSGVGGVLAHKKRLKQIAQDAKRS